MSSGAGRLGEQLRFPDPVGRDLTLLRTRLYRFTDDPRWYVLAEALEERFLTGRTPRPETMTTVRACLDQVRQTGHPPTFRDGLAAIEDIDIRAGMMTRDPFTWQRVPLVAPPTMIVIVVGAPRSGTSHLFNLLASTGHFGYLTTVSCWAWPVRNLRQPGRLLFTSGGDMILGVDNKRTRIIPGLVMPAEAEDAWQRAMPAYRHIRGHLYDIQPQAQIAEPGILQAAVHAHLAHFERTMLLAKSPFNSFRIPRIEQLWGTTVRYIHIVRDRSETADSMRRNHFQFTIGGHLLPAEDAWSHFSSAVQENAPADRTVTVLHAELIRDPHRVTRFVLDKIL